MNLLRMFLSYTFPFLWVLLFICAGFIPERLWQNFHQHLPLVLILIFYFALFAPTKLNVCMVFIFGLLTDFLSASVLGVNAFIFVGMFFMSSLLYPYIHNMSFRHLWFVFCGLMLITDIVWVWLARLTTGVWVSASFWFVQYFFTCLLYPVIICLTAKLNRYTKDL